MVEKLKNGYYKVKSYWRKPPRGYDVSYKEFLAFTVGSGGMSFLSILVSGTAMSYNAFMMMGFGISMASAFILSTVLGSIIALIRAPILSMIIDNSNDKKGRGKFKPLLMWTALVSSVFFFLVPFVPTEWAEIVPITFSIPALPIFGFVTAQSISLPLSLIVVFILVQLGTFFYTLFSQAMIGIEQTISTVAQERANIISLKGIISNIPSSIMNLLIPIIAGIFFGGDQTNISIYKILFPMAVVGGILCLLCMKTVKERVVVKKDYKAKVKFSEGAKALSKNKYFWIITIFNVFVGIRGVSNVVNWIQMSYPDGTPVKTIVGIFNTTILMTILILGMVLAPVFIKKFGKKKVLLVSSIGYLVMIGFQLLVYKYRGWILVASVLQNVFGGFSFVGGIMATDALDFQQWKTGKRLEGFWQNYSGFIATLLGIFTGALPTIFLSMGGIPFDMKAVNFIADPILRDQAFLFSSVLGIIGGVLCLIPLFFYDLDEKKHGELVNVLKIRAAVDNYHSNELNDCDIINVSNAMQLVATGNNEFIADELAKFDCLDAITETKELAFERTAAKHRAECIEDFLRDIELEEKRIEARLLRMQKRDDKIQNKISNDLKLLQEKAEKMQRPFDAVLMKTALTEKAYEKKPIFDHDAKKIELKSKARMMRYFSDERLSKYETVESMAADSENVYDTFLEVVKDKENVDTSNI